MLAFAGAPELNSYEWLGVARHRICATTPPGINHPYVDPFPAKVLANANDDVAEYFVGEVRGSSGTASWLGADKKWESPRRRRRNKIP